MSLKRKFLAGYSVLITVGFIVVTAFYILKVSKQPKDDAEELVTSVEVPRDSTKVWHKNYLKDTLALQYTDSNGVKTPLIGFALDRNDIKRIRESFFKYPKQIFIFFGKKQDKKKQQNYVLMFAGIDKYVKDTTAIILLPKDPADTNSHLLYEYCDPCPPKCPSNYEDLSR